MRETQLCVHTLRSFLPALSLHLCMYSIQRMREYVIHTHTPQHTRSVGVMKRHIPSPLRPPRWPEERCEKEEVELSEEGL